MISKNNRENGPLEREAETLADWLFGSLSPASVAHWDDEIVFSKRKVIKQKQGKPNEVRAESLPKEVFRGAESDLGVKNRKFRHGEIPHSNLGALKGFQERKKVRTVQLVDGKRDFSR
ncbi:hypothetical protein GE061_001530 [Apolygus lucorum]|uniref:Uncharacterized protein n=1 Tax=Apolygus lucorum TaxID=248454 RepID=A0A8S9YBN2_APOLU|nr:hypothetical protein GE061_001530 [Apolygus lucorum]